MKEVSNQERQMRKCLEFAEWTLDGLKRYEPLRGHDGPRIAQSSFDRWVKEKRILKICCENLSLMIPECRSLLENPEFGPFDTQTIREIQGLQEYAGLLYKDYIREKD